MILLKAISSGTTALISNQPPPEQPQIANILDPVLGVSADLFVSVAPYLRAFTPTTEISPPSAAVRMAASFLNSHHPAATWGFNVDGHDVAVSRVGQEYIINHGPWRVAGGKQAIAQGYDATVEFSGLQDPRPGLRVNIGKRQVTVVAVEGAAELANVALSPAPVTAPSTDLVAVVAIMGQRSVELTDHTGRIVGSQEVGALQVRGFEASVGEVFSGDVFAIAGAAAAHAWSGGEAAALEWVTVFGGGNTRVELGQHALASAQAELLAQIELLDFHLG